MRWFVVAVCVLLSACGGTFFKVPQGEYRQRVQTLGVLPLLVDGTGVAHPQSPEVAALLRRHNSGKAERLVEALRQKKGYFDVRLVSADPAGLFSRMVTGSQISDVKGRIYRSYTFNPSGVAELAGREVVDAVLVTIFYGIERREKLWDRTAVPTTYLEADFSSIDVAAAVVAPDGKVLWEYPGQAAGAFLPLQYPGFDEAYYNRSDVVRVHDVTVEGIDRLLAETDAALLSRSDFPRRYKELFESIAAGLDPGLAEKK